MMDNVMQWVAIIVEFIGLWLITVELYFPRLSESLKALFEETKPRIMSKPKTWIGSYILVWIVAVTVLSIWDTSMSFIANVSFTVFTIFFVIMIGISKMFVRLGVVLGRGNSIGGVGLVLTMIGLSLEVYQLVLT